MRQRLIPALAVLALFGASGCAPVTAGAAQTGPQARAQATTDGRTIMMSTSTSFEPVEVTVPAGTLVTWVNADTIPHSSTDDPSQASQAADAALPQGADAWDSGVLAPGDAWGAVLNVPGQYVYFCTLHESEGMVARITVVGS
jgi:plastocyanin